MQGGKPFSNALGFNLDLRMKFVNSVLAKVVMPRVLCLNSSVLIPYLTPEDNSDKAEVLIVDAIYTSLRLVAPCFA